jgi:stage V sporulation protein B
MLLAMAIPLTLNRISGSLFSTAENILLPRSLTAYGLSHTEALSVLGEFTGMCIPLVMFPASLLTALATATLPAVSESNAIGNYKRITSTIHQSTVITAMLAMGTSGVCYFYADYIADIFNATTLLPHLLKTAALICPFTYVQISLSGILNGMGEQVFIFIINLISSIVSISFIILAIPQYGIDGFLYGWLFSSALTSAITVMWLKRSLGFKRSILKQFAIPTLSIIFSCLVTKLLPSCHPLVSMVISCLIYLITLVVSGYITPGVLSQ